MAETLLITGGAGFIGSRLARRALDVGWNVRVFDVLLPQVHGTNPALPDWMTSDCDLRRGDVRDAVQMEAAVGGADLVVHLASETGTGQSMYAIHRYTDVNVSGTAILLEALQRPKARCRKLLIASSRAVYGEGRYLCGGCGLVSPPLRSPTRLAKGIWEPVCPTCGGPIESVPTDEQSATQPVSVYGSTKLAQELLGFNFGNAFGVAVMALRFQNVYGAGQSLTNPYTGILTHFFNAVRRGEAPRVFEDGRESRDFVHVDDSVSAITTALSQPVNGCWSVNVGSGVRTTIHELAKLICDDLGGPQQPVVVSDYRLGDIRHCVADLRRARALLGFEPAVALRSGIKEFLSWAASQLPSSTSESHANRELAALGLLRSAGEP